ncbi:MAG: SprT-like domain-containing protein, partial [Proteobacteria bacterium]|nr:SprT-like domain-containing protein [Pseudomonadota bacterium]
MYKSKPASAVISEELERKILHGIALEWETAKYLLDPKYRKFLQIPAFSLKDMKRRLGYWSGEKNEICINRDLALSCKWDFVKKILLHEMAHQVAQQIFGAEAETPHGPLFKKACYILRADYKASENYSINNNNIEADDHDTTILLRIKKLFALAESSNRNEAESAMKKAHELVAKYNIEIIANDSDRHFTSISAGGPALRHPKEDYYLAGLLRDYYFVWTIWVPAYIIEKGKMGRVLELSGTLENIEIASYVHDFIKHYIESRWLEYNNKKQLNRHRKTDFAAGIIKGFSTKL